MRNNHAHFSTVRELMGKLLVAFALIVLTVLFTPVSEWLHAPLIVDEPVHDTEALIILSTNEAHQTDSGMLDFATLARVTKGVEVFNAVAVDRIFVVGGNRVPRAGLTVASLMQEELVRVGIPPEMVVLQDSIPGDFNYYDNLMQLPERYSEIDFDKAIVVTSSHNTFRIKRAFRKRGLNTTIVSTEPYALYPANWHFRFENFRDVANEYWAILLFYLLGRI